MKVKIIKANLPTYWYAKKVGKVFTVRKSGFGYVVIDPIPEEAGYYIDVDDAVEVTEDKPKKVCSFKVDFQWVKGDARKVLFDAVMDQLLKQDNLAVSTFRAYLAYLIVVDGKVSSTDSTTEFNKSSVPEVSVNNALKGNFWTYSTKKEEPKPEGYKVSLAMYSGKAREAVSKAIQEEAFRKGFSWNGERQSQYTGATHLYFWMSDSDICWENDQKYFDAHRYKELSVEEILSGALPSVK